VVYFYLTGGFESSETWRSHDRLIMTVRTTGRQTDFEAKSTLQCDIKVPENMTTNYVNYAHFKKRSMK
jgi:hypothetical protein